MNDWQIYSLSARPMHRLSANMISTTQLENWENPNKDFSECTSP